MNEHCVIILTDAEKAFDKIQYPLRIEKTVKQILVGLEIEEKLSGHD